MNNKIIGKTLLTSNHIKRAIILFSMLFMIYPAQTQATMSGVCSNCHTMHNSQDNSPMATYGATGKPWKGTGVNNYLTRGGCLGCHGMGTSSNIEDVGGSMIPQVYHTNATDLAGGNFAYIIGAKGSGADDAKGHNVLDLGNLDDTLEYAPGFFPSQHLFQTLSENLTCAGPGGCHGNRGVPGTQGMGAGILVMKGAHHSNEGGQLNVADEIYNSFRFLRGVKGFENDTWLHTNADHNEYFGDDTPAALGCPSTSCHSALGIRPPNNTISGFCSTCHGSFHVLDDDAYLGIDFEGIGGTLVSPFTRHPTDVLMPGNGEYSAYATYNKDAPVARQAVPAVMSSSVGSTDVVMCLSCHMAHASDEPDMLRWGYGENEMVSAGGGAIEGCFICHTEKN